MILLPLFIAFFSVFLSTNVPPPYWSFEYGLGGIFGDTFLKKLLIYQPIEINQWLQLIAVVCLTFSIFLFFPVAGLKKQEVSTLLRNRFMHFTIFLGGLYTALGICIKIISQTGKNSSKSNTLNNDSIALSNPEEKNQSYIDKEQDFSTTKENERDA